MWTDFTRAIYSMSFRLLKTKNQGESFPSLNLPSAIFLSFPSLCFSLFLFFTPLFHLSKNVFYE